MSRGRSRRSVELIGACHGILAEIQPASVRAVCYRLFVAGYIASMAKAETNKVSHQLARAREDGRIPWDWIVDETRSVEAVTTWDDPEGFAASVMRSYTRNKWDAQPARIEVWSEKGTVRGTLEPVLDRYEVPFRVMHGYASATAIQDVVQASLSAAKPLTVLYVGDWDPSGLHMSEHDLPDRLHTYRARECEARGIRWWDDGAPGDITLVRLALNAADVADPALPPFPADTKQRDSRWQWYVREYGSQCWELDALSPVQLRARVQAMIESQLDTSVWTRYVEAEAIERASITSAVRTWGRLKAPV